VGGVAAFPRIARRQENRRAISLGAAGRRVAAATSSENLCGGSNRGTRLYLALQIPKGFSKAGSAMPHYSFTLDGMSSTISPQSLWLLLFSLG